MNKQKSISIAIPTLNEEKNIQRCLNSIFKQKYRGKVEVLVVDGDSKDKTIEIAKRYKVKILKNPKRDAESGKMVGLRNSHGYYFMILDADMDLRGDDWFEKMTIPLEEDSRIVGTFTRFVAEKEDSFLSRYITIDPIQRDPLFRFLTPDPKQVLLHKKKNYWVCRYSDKKIVPAGFCLYRRKDLLALKIDRRHKFMELDTLSILVKTDLNIFAYVPSAGIHHPFLRDLKMLIRKRVRNLNTQFFNQPDERVFTWIDFESKSSVLKIIVWVLYANSLILPTIVGLIRAVRYRNLIALYEPIFVWITTNVIILTFLRSREGRSLFLRLIS